MTFTSHHEVPMPEMSTTPHTVKPPQTQAFPTLSAGAVPSISSGMSHMLGGIPGYEIGELLGEGGMGVVHRGRQLALDRVVALKRIVHGSAEARVRFQREAHAVARLQHPGIVQIFEVGETADGPYLSLEFCAGGSLANHLDGTPLPPMRAARLIENLADTVHAAHEAGIVHRDLKPGNVLLVRRPTTGLGDDNEELALKISDFGLAKLLDSQQPAQAATQTGAVLGTPSYMAPEQAAAKPAGPVADVYALGAILYELLVGRPPFKAASVMDTLMQVMRDEPVSPRVLQPKVPRDLETICLKCLEKDPVRRYPSAAALAADLVRYREGRPIQARPTNWAEQTIRWVRRRPAVAALLMALLMSVVGGMSGSMYYAVQANAALEKLRQREANRREKEVGLRFVLFMRKNPDLITKPAKELVTRFLDANKDISEADLVDALKPAPVETPGGLAGVALGETAPGTDAIAAPTMIGD
jgi:hypothetical protein